VTADVRLLLDEMLSPAVAEQLRQRGMDVVAVVALPHLVSLPDEELLVEATIQGRIPVTANVRDFAALSKGWVGRPQQHAQHGLVYVSSRAFPQDRSYVGAGQCSSLGGASGDAPGGGRGNLLAALTAVWPVADGYAAAEP
jgi:predicted nuclease of predicted toxin-antitoxin system